LLEILGAFVSRAAMLTAANLASAVLVTDFGKDEDHPVLINADGTTFHSIGMLKSLVTEYLDAYLSEKGRRAVITQVPDSPVLGSAIGALSI
ncbi:MAG: hexokinase, partial [Spirochaetales bacterium]|nr:hexokinase [Spirochaetales bacterium]